MHGYSHDALNTADIFEVLTNANLNVGTIVFTPSNPNLDEKRGMMLQPQRDPHHPPPIARWIKNTLRVMLGSLFRGKKTCGKNIADLPGQEVSYLSHLVSP